MSGLDEYSDIQKMWRAYQVHGSCRRAAAVLGISYQTVRRRLKAAGYDLQPRGGEHPPYHFGCLAQWLRDNPGKGLPRSPSAIARITGCSVDSVKSYLYRRRRALRTTAPSEGTASKDLVG